MDWTDARVYGYAVKLARRFAPKFVGELDEDDLMQEFAFDFLEVEPIIDRSRGDAAFMAMLKMKFRWTLLELLRKRRRRISTCLASEIERNGYVDRSSRHQHVGNHGYTDILECYENDSPVELLSIHDLVRTAPVPIQKYFIAIMNGDLHPRRDGSMIESAQEAICRVTGMQQRRFSVLLRKWCQSHLEFQNFDEIRVGAA